MIIVGSKALVHNYTYISRIPKDTDVIGFKSDAIDLKEKLNPLEIKEGDDIITLINIQNKTDIYNTDNVEILLADNSNSLKGYLNYDSDKLYASPEVLFSLKKSHIHFPIKFNKHIEDFIFLKDKLVLDSLSELTKIRFKETENRLGKLKTPSLNKSVKQFFNQSNDFVKSYFIHDDIHKAVSHYSDPLYLRMQENKEYAKCEKYLWEKFTYDEKCKCVLEEAYVIALERKILPSIFGNKKWFTSDEAIKWSLMRICTTLCSGWFREFATNNYFNILSIVNNNYVVDFLQKYNNGEIKRINE